MSESLISSPFSANLQGGLVTLESSETFSRDYENTAQSATFVACGSAELFSDSSANKIYFFTVGNVRGIVAHPSLISSISISWRYEDKNATIFSVDGRNSSYTVTIDEFGLVNGKTAKLPVGATLSISTLNISCQISYSLYFISI